MAEARMIPNLGSLPAEAAGKKVMVELGDGRIRGPWPADGKGACSWRLTGDWFNIRAYQVLT